MRSTPQIVVQKILCISHSLMSRLPRWSTQPQSDLWNSWRSIHTCDASAIAHAVFCGNRLVKSLSPVTRTRFYQLKDLWIKRNQEHLVYGARARDETMPCPRCKGSGKTWFTDPCDRCAGSGSIAQSTLWLHNFDIVGAPYSFHSYVQPSRIDENRSDAQRGTSSFSLAHPFSKEEEAALPLPAAGLIKVLEYVSQNMWGVRYEASGQFFSPAIKPLFEQKITQDNFSPRQTGTPKA